MSITFTITTDQRHSQNPGNPGLGPRISNCALYKHQYQDTLIEQSDRLTQLSQLQYYVEKQLSRYRLLRTLQLLEDS